MRGYRFLIVTAMMLLIMGIANLPAHAESKEQHVFDDAHILTNDEAERLESTAVKSGDKNEVDFIIITTENDEDIKKYMGDMYDEHGFGYDKKHGDTAIIALNMKSHNVQLGGFGDVEFTLPDERFDLIKDKVIPILSDGDYENAFTEFINLSVRYMQFKEGANPANPLYNPYIQIIIALALGIIVVAMLAWTPKGRLTTTAATYFNDRLSKINRKQDRYLRKTVTKTYSPKRKNGGGGGKGGGFSGGGMTSGGRSFSGSRGKF